MTRQALVSVIVPCLNRAGVVGETLDSVANQGFRDWECICVDDHSVDGTAEVVESYAERDERFRFYPRPASRTPGAPSCRNAGMEATSGDYVVFVDSDDILEPTCLERRVDRLRTFPDRDFAVFQSELFEHVPGDLGTVPNLLTKDADDLERFIGHDYPWNTSAALIRRSSLEHRIGQWDEALSCHQDLDLYIRAICNGCRYIKIDGDPDVHIRMGNRDKTSNASRSDPDRLDSRLRLARNTAGYLRENGLFRQPYTGKLLDLCVFHSRLLIAAKQYRRFVGQVSFLVKSGLLPPTGSPRYVMDAWFQRLQASRRPWARWMVKAYGRTGVRERLEDVPPAGSTLGRYSVEDCRTMAAGGEDNIVFCGGSLRGQ